MKDIDLDILKDYVSEFDSYESFIKDYCGENQSIDNRSLSILYSYAHYCDDIWNMYKYLKSEESFRLDNYRYENIDDIVSIAKIYKKYKVNRYKRFIIRLDNKTYKNIEKLKDIGYDVIILVNGDKGYCTVDEFIKMREFFDGFKELYGNYNLSELEAITLCYDYTKFFFYNSEESDNRTESRSIVQLLKTGHIVCEGYSKIFSQLLCELGIESYLMYVTQSNNRRHCRVIIDINDDKYSKNGYFIFDPTWDSAKDLFAVIKEDGTKCFKKENDIKDNEIAIKKLPSSIMYLYYLVDIKEYELYFKNEVIDEVILYNPYGTNEDRLDDLFISNDGEKTKMNIDNFEKIIRKIKRIEGYSKQQIDDYVNDSLNIIYRNRYKTLRKN